MEKIDNLVIITTPFHKEVVEKIFPNLINESSTLVLYSKFVDASTICTHKILLFDYKFSRSELFSKPLKNYKNTVTKFRKVKNDVENINQKFNFSNNLKIVICSDSDIFTQLMLNSLFKQDNKRELIAIEEGLGFYLRTTLKDKLFALIYKVLTPILFGSKLYYVKRMGVYPKIKTIYVRDITLLPKKLKNIDKYKEFSLNRVLADKKPIMKGVILFFSFPDQDYQMDESIKYKLILEIANFAKKRNKVLTIKPHPRENIRPEKFKGLTNIVILDKSIVGESLDYYDYEFIINFFSSIILDIVEYDYPKSNLLTIGLLQKPLIEFKDGLKYCSLKDFIASDLIKI